MNENYPRKDCDSESGLCEEKFDLCAIAGFPDANQEGVKMKAICRIWSLQNPSTLKSLEELLIKKLRQLAIAKNHDLMYRTYKHERWVVCTPRSPIWHQRGQDFVYSLPEMKGTIKTALLAIGWRQHGLVCKQYSGNRMEVPLDNWCRALMIIFTSICTHPGDHRKMSGFWQEEWFPLNITKISLGSCIINHERGYERASGLCYTISHVLIKAETIV